MNTTSKRILAAGMALLLAAGSFIPAFASEKEEVIYAKLDADGKVQGVYAVNSFDGGSISDYGSYSEVKLLDHNGEITYADGKVQFTVPEGESVSYQGTLTEANLPWDISVTYLLNGEIISPEQLAGKSGELEIKIKVEKNEASDGDFYDTYALQCSLTLDTEKCKNIKADGATVANVGSDKQLTYTVLPKSSLDCSITASVTDFEMEGISFNGILMTLSVGDHFDAETLGTLSDGTDELYTGVNGLVDGVAELSSGVCDYADGVEQLYNGLKTVYDGAVQLNENALPLCEGSDNFYAALLTLQQALIPVEQSVQKIDDLLSTSAQISQGLTALAAGVDELSDAVNAQGYRNTMAQNGLDIEMLVTQNDKMLLALQEQITSLSQSLVQLETAGYEQQAAQLKGQIAQIQAVITLLQANSAAVSGAESYLDAASLSAEQLALKAEELSSVYTEFDTAITGLTAGMTEMLISFMPLAEAVNTLTVEYAKLNEGITTYSAGTAQIEAGMEELLTGAKTLMQNSIDLVEGTNKVYDGAVKLQNGTDTMYDSMKEMTDSDELESLLALLERDQTPISFTDEKNGSPKLVQFVISTQGIKAADPAPAAVEESTMKNFWQKLLALFGIGDV